MDKISILNNWDAHKYLVVAHPDDESLFFGGIVSDFPNNWTIIACSIPYNEPIRAWKFFDACDVLGASGRLLPWKEERNQPIAYLQELWAVLNNDAALIVTHSSTGEYGHPAHISLHHFIKDRWKEKALFGCYGTKSNDIVLTLNLSEYALEAKNQALQCYNQPFIFKGKTMPGYKALLKQYGPDKFNPAVECYE